MVKFKKPVSALEGESMYNYNYEQKQIVLTNILGSFLQLDETEQKLLAETCHVQLFTYNEIIELSARPSDSLYFMVSGLVACRTFAREAEEVDYLQFYKQGQCFLSLDSFSSQEKLNLELVAFDGEVTLVKIPSKIVMLLRERSRSFEMFLFLELKAQLERMLIFELYCYQLFAKNRVIASLCYLALFYGQDQHNGWICLPHKLTRGILASFARTSRSSVTEVLTQLVAENLALTGRYKMLLDKNFVLEQFEGFCFRDF